MGDGEGRRSCPNIFLANENSEFRLDYIDIQL